MQVNGLVFEARESKSANGTNASQERWLRAVDKFRTYEADLVHRAERSKKWKANTARPLTKPSPVRSPQRCVLARSGFDELWDGLTSDQHNGVNVSIPAASLAPLPRSVSLMVVETRQASRDRPGPGDRHASKKVLEKRVPQEILNRKKVGFPVPYSNWMRSELRSWVSDILLDSRTMARGYFQKKAVEYILDENLKTGRFAKEVFSLVTLELWHRAFI